MKSSKIGHSNEAPHGFCIYQGAVVIIMTLACFGFGLTIPPPPMPRPIGQCGILWVLRWMPSTWW